MKKQDLAARLGVTKKSVSMMARNEPISMRLLDKICKELGCQVQDVIEYVPDED
ncbi:MAG: helix-turn-helix domain-containing protein [Lachnospiraceae bacterium]|jgi:DNA-binding Xre family transcriptional regulator|nr:helix-turn-helix domain-containing protein [Lachnospiraceae bacterium]